MNVSEFDYELALTSIAQEPPEHRGDSRLLVLDRRTGATAHRRFADLAAGLAPRDLLVLNDTKVIPARLHGVKPSGGRVEMLLVEPVGDDAGAPVWRALIGGSRSIAPGMMLTIPGGLSVVPVAREGESWRVRLVHEGGDPMAAIAAAGEMPLPSYIRRDGRDPRAGSDRERYQTVYARAPGAVAAPTAGLHFTTEHLEALRAGGVASCTLTLHVGLGTFLPVRVERVEDHVMHEEVYALPDAASDAIAETRRSGGRVVAVGTTVARVLESCAGGEGLVHPGAGRSSLFIYPGFRFSVVDALLTNFHLPRSTLLMMVCAFAGTSAVLRAYREAVSEGYRFYSYGDAMLVRSA